MTNYDPLAAPPLPGSRPSKRHESDMHCPQQWNDNDAAIAMSNQLRTGQSRKLLLTLNTAPVRCRRACTEAPPAPRSRLPPSPPPLRRRRRRRLGKAWAAGGGGFSSNGSGSMETADLHWTAGGGGLSSARGSGDVVGMVEAASRQNKGARARSPSR